MICMRHTIAGRTRTCVREKMYTHNTCANKTKNMPRGEDKECSGLGVGIRYRLKKLTDKNFCYFWFLRHCLWRALVKAQSPSQIMDDRFFDGGLDERPTVAHHGHAGHNYK